MWLYDASDDKRECPVRGRNCYPPTFDSYRQMLEHCRQQHPDRLPFGGDTTTELVVTDIQGKVLSAFVVWLEIEPSQPDDERVRRRQITLAPSRGGEVVLG